MLHYGKDGKWWSGNIKVIMCVSLLTIDRNVERNLMKSLEVECLLIVICMLSKPTNAEVAFFIFFL